MPHPRLIAAAVVLACATASPAHANHGERERDVDDTPYLLRPAEARIGLFKSQLGLFGHPLLRRIQLGTSHAPWLLAVATGARTYNGHVKVRLHEDSRLAISAGAGHTFIGFGPDSVPMSVRITPLELAVGIRLHRRFTVTSNLVHTHVELRGEMDDTAGIDQLWGAIGADTTQVRSAMEFRVSRHTALSLGARVIAGQTLYARAGAAEDVGETTEVSNETTATTEAMSMRGDVTVRAAVHYSFDSVNLKLGVQYGTPTVPGINLAVPVRVPMPIFDVYWRF